MILMIIFLTTFKVPPFLLSLHGSLSCGQPFVPVLYPSSEPQGCPCLFAKDANPALPPPIKSVLLSQTHTCKRLRGADACNQADVLSCLPNITKDKPATPSSDLVTKRKFSLLFRRA